MEDPAKLAAFTDWAEKSSNATVAELAQVPVRPAFGAFLDQATRAGVKISNATSASGQRLFLRQDPSDRVPKLMVGEVGRDRVLFDPMLGHIQMEPTGNYSVSPNARMVAVQVSTGALTWERHIF